MYKGLFPLCAVYVGFCSVYMMCVILCDVYVFKEYWNRVSCVGRINDWCICGVCIQCGLHRYGVYVRAIYTEGVYMRGVCVLHVW